MFGSIAVQLARWYLELRPAYPAPYITGRRPFERAEMEYADELNGDAFLPLFDIDLRGLDVLDLGCGYGGRTVRYKELGARSVVGIEVVREPAWESVAFGKVKGASIAALVAVGEALPFRDGSFDAILSYDVFEHVCDLRQTLQSCHRVLRPGGTLYAVFPPVHHPTGGSHLHGYVSSSPLPNVLFSTRTLMAAIDGIVASRGQTPPTLRPGDYLPSVNGATVASFEQDVEAIPFTRRAVTLRPLRVPAPARAMVRAATRLPGLREVTTSRIIARLTK